MATEEPHNGDVSDAAREVQLMNLGRIIENPHLVREFMASDFTDREICSLVSILKSDKPNEAKNFHLKAFMKNRGVNDWGDLSSGCRKALFDTQRRQKLLGALLFWTHLVVEDLTRMGSSPDKTKVLETIDQIRACYEDSGNE